MGGNVYYHYVCVTTGDWTAQRALHKAKREMQVRINKETPGILQDRYEPQQQDKHEQQQQRKEDDHHHHQQRRRQQQQETEGEEKGQQQQPLQ